MMLLHITNANLRLISNIRCVRFNGLARAWRATPKGARIECSGRGRQQVATSYNVHRSALQGSADVIDPKDASASFRFHPSPILPTSAVHPFQAKLRQHLSHLMAYCLDALRLRGSLLTHKRPPLVTPQSAVCRFPLVFQGLFSI